MRCQDAMETLSQCGIGMLIMSEQGVVLDVNAAGDRLLHGNGSLIGKPLDKAASPLLQESKKPLYANVAFGEYLVRCPAPVVSDLPVGAACVTFRSATGDVGVDTLIQVLNQMPECVVLCDGQGRIVYLNDAAVSLDGIVTRDVAGEHVTSVYKMSSGDEFQIPRALREKRPLLHQRHRYTTQFGKYVEAVSNTFPIVQNGQVLGAVNILEDWSTIDKLNRQIVELQEKLLARDSGRKLKKSALTAGYHFSDIIYTSPIMKSVITQCMQVAKSDSSVMIYGETGTGKELLAQSIHNASRRADGPFLAINCAALPENLLESMLFGTEKGAFTGAESRPGLFEQADHGTLLLDEINSMNIVLQAKLLRVLQDGMIRRVGGMTEIHVDVRVLSNINITPYQAIQDGTLRRDLFFRLGVVNINLPPLRDRREDIPLLTKKFIMSYNEKLFKNILDVDQATLSLFNAYDWPGNVRELQHAVEHAMNLLPDDRVWITPEYVPAHICARRPDSARSVSPVFFGGSSPDSGPQETERQTICRLLAANHGNITETARLLNMSRQSLQYRLKRYKIDVKNLLQEKEQR